MWPCCFNYVLRYTQSLSTVYLHIMVITNYNFVICILHITQKLYLLSYFFGCVLYTQTAAGKWSKIRDQWLKGCIPVQPPRVVIKEKEQEHIYTHTHSHTPSCVFSPFLCTKEMSTVSSAVLHVPRAYRTIAGWPITTHKFLHHLQPDFHKASPGCGCLYGSLHFITGNRLALLH